MNLYDFWVSNKNVWFNPTQSDDEYITKTFFKDEYFSLFTLKNLDNFKKGIEIIILFDQIPRHASRVLSNINCDEYTLKIIDFAEKFYCKHKYSLNSDDFAFILLPLRHSKIYDKILYVINETIIKIKYYPKDSNYKRFLKATLEKYIVQCDDTINIEQFIPIDFVQEIVDLDLICELGLEIYRPKPIENNISANCNNFYQKFIKKPIDGQIIISLSGGVDSMVMSYILTKIYGKNKVVAVHINYNNRKECDSEVKIIKEWCSFLKIKLFIRKIIELTRTECMQLELRDLYETFTRNIRYSTYVNVSKIIDSNVCTVYMGHNQDDRFENILTNIISESLYSNLNGMKIETIHTSLTQLASNITFIRPMLNICKSEIFSFANFCQIPHFVDSTPKWSQRGKIRDQIRPAIEEFEPKSIKSFFALSDVLSELMSILDMLAESYVKKIKEENKLYINVIEKIPEKMLLSSIFKKLGYTITQKGLESFYEKILFIRDNFDKYKYNAKNFYQLNKSTKLEWKKINSTEFVIIM